MPQRTGYLTSCLSTLSVDCSLFQCCSARSVASSSLCASSSASAWEMSVEGSKACTASDARTKTFARGKLGYCSVAISDASGIYTDYIDVGGDGSVIPEARRRERQARGCRMPVLAGGGRREVEDEDQRLPIIAPIDYRRGVGSSLDLILSSL